MDIGWRVEREAYCLYSGFERGVINMTQRAEEEETKLLLCVCVGVVLFCFLDGFRFEKRDWKRRT